MLYDDGPKAAPMAQESLDGATICFDIRAAW